MEGQKKRSSLIASMFQKKLKSKESQLSSLQESENEEIPPLPSLQQNESVSPSPSPQTQDIVMDFEYDVELLPHDPGQRKSISAFPLKEQDRVRKTYILRGPCQPKGYSFPQRKMGDKDHRFVVTWFDMFDWLEYSVVKDAAFCFVCYLFKNDAATSVVGGDAFVTGGGYRSWNKPEGFQKHVGKINSAHQLALQKFQALKDPNKSIIVVLDKQSDTAKVEHKSRLQASLKCLRFLLRQGLSIRGHDESQDSVNRGNFLELLQWLADIDDKIGKYVLKNAPKNNQLIAPSIQKDIINACAQETTKIIMQELGDDYFSILTDESSDVSHREQLALCLRFVDKKGRLIERFLGIVHVQETTALALKSAIESLLMEHSLNLSQIRGQGYDGASNMSGEINGLKSLILRENPYAYYIHCFAHQLQLTQIAVAKINDDCQWFFEAIATLLNVIGVSCKRNEMLRESQLQKVAKALEDGELKTGSGLNQEIRLSRPGDTRWGSHHRTLVHIISLYPDMVSTLLKIGKSKANDRVKAQGVLFALESFDFVLMVHVMTTIFGYTHELNLALQRNDQDIVNAMSFVSLTKRQLQTLRDDGWDTLLNKILLFCDKHKIHIPNMDDQYIPRGRSRRFVEDYTNLHHYRVQIFLKVVDLQLQELNNRFDEVSMELLQCMACLNPINSFDCFDKQKLLRLAEFYPDDFSTLGLFNLDFQLDNFITDMRSDKRFSDLKDLGQLSTKLVETGKHVAYQPIYRLLKLVLILPVATASVERVFSGMKYVKNRLRNSMGDQFLNDCLVTFIEKDAFLKVSDDDVIDRFHKMKTRRGQL